MSSITPKDLIKKLSKQRLAELLVEAALQDNALNERLTLELLGDQTTAIAAEIKVRIRQATRPRSFVSYHEAPTFTNRLYDIASSIKERVLPIDPDMAIALCVELLNTDRHVYEFVDDSGGDIGIAYCMVSEIFVEAALEARDRSRLVMATLERIRKNEYGSADSIHSASGRFLSEDEFLELLQFLKDDYDKTCGDDSYSSEKFKYERAAESSGDPDLLKKVLLETGGDPLSEYARLRVARLLSACERHEEALSCIDSVDSRMSSGNDIETIRIAALSSMGRQEEIIAIYERNFRKALVPETYDTWVGALPDTEHAAARDSAIALARASCTDPEEGIRLLLHLGEARMAADFTLENLGEISGGSWYSLPEYAKRFEKTGREDAAIPLYRKLTEDILDNSRRKAYGHAARYWQKLDQLAQKLEPLLPLEPNAAYKARLTLQHKRKSAFWKRVKELL